MSKGSPDIYLSGPMSGIPDLNFPAFAAATASLRAQGYVVFSPAEQGAEGTLEEQYAKYLPNDIRAVLECEEVRVLPGWEQSRGACLEVMTAVAIGKPVKKLDGWPIYLTLDRPAPKTLNLGDPTYSTPDEETILEEAERYVGGARNQDYGHPLDDMTRTATLWGAILGVPDAISAEQVALCMIAVKISRLCNDISKRDSQVDIAGYARCIERMQRRRAGKE